MRIPCASILVFQSSIRDLYGNQACHIRHTLEETITFSLVYTRCFWIENSVLKEYNAPKSGNESVVIPDGVTVIGKNVFKDCLATRIVVPEGVIRIAEGAFEYYPNLTSIVLPNTITKIEREAFASCKSLVSILIPDSVISLGERVFMWCEKLTEMTLSKGLLRIGKEAFKESVYRWRLLHVLPCIFL